VRDEESITEEAGADQPASQALRPPLNEVTGGATNTSLANRWNDWIAAHRDELQKLAPTGEGVDYSERACKGGKPVRR